MATLNTTKKSYKKIKPIHLIIMLVVVALVVGGIFAFKEYSKLKDENKKLSNPQESAKLETDKVKGEVANIIDVPTDEEPTIATVSDVSKLSGQAFFSKAQNGDKLIMYSKAKKAILYRPSTKKVIEVAPINLGDSSQDKTTSTQPTQETTQNPTTSDPNLATQPGIQQ